MLKKMFSVMLLALSLFLGSHALDTSRAEAVDVYVGQANGVDVYVNTDSITVYEKRYQKGKWKRYYFAVTTKNVSHSTGALCESNRWEYSFKDSLQKGEAVTIYRLADSNKWSHVEAGSLKKKICDIVLNYIR